MRVERERNGHMNAAVLYGAEDMKIESVDIPALADDEVLVRVEVALTCGTDLKVWKQGFHQRMIKPPSLFGHELAGVIELKGSAVNSGIPRRHARGACEFRAVQRLPLLPQRASRIFAKICCSTMAPTRNTFASPEESCGRTCC